MSVIMKKEIADKWVKALRSGSYRQTQSYLSVKENGKYKYCCLGVLCQIALKEGVVKEYNTKCFAKIYDNCDTALPTTVKHWAGMKTDLGFVDGAASSLAYLNDRIGYKFSEIADHIEKNWEKL